MVASYSEDQIITSDPRQILEITKAKEEWAKLAEESGPVPSPDVTASPPTDTGEADTNPILSPE